MDVLRLALLATIVTTSGCFTEADTAETEATATATGTGTGTGDSGSTGTTSTTTGGVDSTSTSGATTTTGETGSCEAAVVEVASLVADVGILEGTPTLNQGDLSLSNIGVGRLLLGYEVSPDVVDAIETGTVESMTLLVPRLFEDDSHCQGECPAQAGVFTAFPLRNDWAEGVGNTTQPGATWQRRISDGDVWGQAGASLEGEDHAQMADSVNVDASQAEMVFELDPTTWTSEWIDGVRLSVMVIAEGSGIFVTPTRENMVASPPRLEVVFCP